MSGADDAVRTPGCASAGPTPVGSTTWRDGFVVTDGKVAAIDLLADPETLGALDLEILRLPTTDYRPLTTDH